MLQPRSAHAAKRAEGGNEVDGFESIGLPLGVVAQQQMEAWRKINIQPRVIAEVPKAQMGQMHDLRMASDGLPGESFSLVYSGWRATSICLISFSRAPASFFVRRGNLLPSMT